MYKIELNKQSYAELAFETIIALNINIIKVNRFKYNVEL